MSFPTQQKKEDMKNIKLKITLFFVALAALCLPVLLLAGSATHEYDEYDQLERSIYEDGPVVLYSYDDFGNVASRKVISNRVIRISYDGLGTVSVSPEGDSCGVGCYYYEASTFVNISAAPSQGYSFAGWFGGACNSNPCYENIDTNKYLTGSFVAPSFNPTDLTATIVSAGRVDLDWTHNDGSETGFKVERSLIPDDYTEIATVMANVTTFSDYTGLVPDTIYSYRVRAYNDYAHSEYSNEVEVNLTGYSITVVQEENNMAIHKDGQLVTDTDVTVFHGDDAQFRMVPDTGYMVGGNVMVDGQSAGSRYDYAFTNVTSDHTLVAPPAVSAGALVPILLDILD